MFANFKEVGKFLKHEKQENQTCPRCRKGKMFLGTYDNCYYELPKTN